MNNSKIYFHGFDVLRVAAIFAVVWIHGCDTHMLTRRWSGYASFAVPVFILMSFFLLQLSVLSHPDRGMWKVLGCRLHRLIPAYLVWTTLYLAVRLLKHHMLNMGAGLDHWTAMIFMGGASYQLYFIAALIYWSLLFLPLLALSRRYAEHPVGCTLALLILGICLFVVGSHISGHIRVPPEYSMLRHAAGLTGFVPIGMAMAIGWKNWISGSPYYPARKLAALFLVLAAVCVAVKPMWGFHILMSLILFLWGIHYTGMSIPVGIRRIAGLSFGIYMVHGFFVEGLQTAAVVMGLQLDSLPLTLLVIVASFFLSYSVCEIMDMFPKLKWLVN